MNEKTHSQTLKSRIVAGKDDSQIKNQIKSNPSMLDSATASTTNMRISVGIASVLAFALGVTTKNVILINSLQSNFTHNNHESGIFQGKNSSLQTMTNVSGDSRIIPVSISMDGSSSIHETYESLFSDDVLSSESSSQFKISDRKKRFPLPSSVRADEAYYESVVHPGMITHDKPSRVAIIGVGREGAILREVLKHNVPQQVTVFDVDEVMVKEYKENVTARNYCGDIEGSKLSCFNDPRVKLVRENVVTWFVDKYFHQGKGNDDQKGDNVAEQFDVIIVNLVDPKDASTSANAMYKNEMYPMALSNALRDNGILILAQSGETAASFSSKTEFSLVSLLYHLEGPEESEDYWFQSFHVYEEAPAQYGPKWATAVVCKSFSCRENWFCSGPDFDVDIYKRMLSSTTSTSLLTHFDGATMMRYQIPHKTYETLFCNEDGSDNTECRTQRGIPHDHKYVHSKDLFMKESSIGHGGLGLFTKVDIPVGSSIALDKSIDPVYLSPFTLHIMRGTLNEDDHPVYQYADWYGYDGGSLSDQALFVETGTTAFANHGCRGSYNIIAPVDLETNADDSAAMSVWHEFTENVDSLVGGRVTAFSGFGYHPVVDRRLVSLDNRNEVAKRDIKAGEELFSNYLLYSSEDFEEHLEKLKTMCG